MVKMMQEVGGLRHFLQLSHPAYRLIRDPYVRHAKSMLPWSKVWGKHGFAPCRICFTLVWNDFFWIGYNNYIGNIEYVLYI